MLNSSRHAMGLWAALLIALTGMGLAIAQVGGDGTEGEDATVEGRSTEALTAPEQVAEAQRVQSHASLLSERVLGMLDEARRDGDIVRATCLDDKLTQINAHLRTLGERMGALDDSVSTGDDARRNHEFTVISVLGQNFSQLERDANECIGNSLTETGSTRVAVDVDPNSPDEDPSVVGVPPLSSPGIPPPGSI